jgi:sigma-E factor negative regulatory protein RseB
MKQRYAVKIIIYLMAILGVDVHALTPAQQLVEKMSMSAKNLSYKGFFNYEQGQQSSSYEIIHKVDGDIEKQRLVFLDGSAFEVISDGHSLKCLHAGDVSFQSPHSHNFEANPSKFNEKSLTSIWKHYLVSIDGSARVANRMATKVKLIPNDTHRFPFEFFVDDKTGLMLKMVVLDMKQQPIERFHFVSIDFDNVSDQDLVPHIKDYVVVEHSKHQTLQKNSPAKWQLTWIPSGFQQENAKMNAWMPEAEKQHVYMYSDGLSAFSVFVEKARDELMHDTSTQQGSTSAVTHVMTINGEQIVVTVVGEIPIMTAKQIALSLEPAT